MSSTRRGSIRRRIVTVLVATGLLIAVIPLQPRVPRVWAAVDRVPLAWSADARGARQSEAVAAPLTMVAVSWDADTSPPGAVWYRVRGDGGPWSSWQELPLVDDHGPDPDDPEARDTRPASEAVWTGPQDEVQFMVAGGEAEAVEGVLIDTTSRSQPLTRRIRELFTPRPVAEPAGAVEQPGINPRSSWDPAGKCRPKAPPEEVQVTHLFVHHTAGTNSYSREDVAAQILGICLFHTGTNGWDDIGYNFLIDRFGGIWEGRAGGITEGVQGAHTAGFNSYSTGVAILGDLNSQAPTTASRTALTNLMTWKLGIHNVDPDGSSYVVSKGSNRWPEGTRVRLAHISGHRDAQSTSCPGDMCYGLLPGFRASTAARYPSVPATAYTPLVGDFRGDGTEQGLVFRQADGTWQVTTASGSTGVWGRYSTRTGWETHLVGDFNGDNRDDIVSYHPSNGTWWVSTSTGAGFTTKLWGSYSTRTGWETHLVGDFNGDNRDDIVSYHPSNGTWWVSTSTGAGFTTRLWGSYSTRTGWETHLVGDFNGDNRDDIVSYHPSNGTWWVSRSTGAALRPGLWGTLPSEDHWSLVSVTDANGDGRHDLAAFDAYDGTLHRLISGGSGFATSPVVDAPWRTTLVREGRRPGGGADMLVFFAQEFRWLRYRGLASGSGSWEELAAFPIP